MTFIRMYDNPDVTQEQYDAASQAVGVTAGNMPEGSVLHAAGAGPNGWRVIEIWESEEAAAKFDEERVEPILRQVGITRPAPETWQAHNLVMRGG